LQLLAWKIQWAGCRYKEIPPFRLLSGATVSSEKLRRIVLPVGARLVRALFGKGNPLLARQASWGQAAPPTAAAAQANEYSVAFVISCKNVFRFGTILPAEPKTQGVLESAMYRLNSGVVSSGLR